MTDHDDERFDVLYRTHAHTVLAYLRRRVAEHDARDVAAEVFTVAWRRRDQVPEAAGPWLLGVARRQLANHHRGERRRHALRTRIAAQPDPPAASPAPVDDRLGRALHELSDGDRELVLLIGWDELTPAEAAQVIGVAPRTARARLHRARRRLEAALDATDREESRP